jgi:transposase
MNKIYVGLDVSQKDLKVHIQNHDGDEVIKPFAVDNNVAGANILIDRIVQTCKKSDTQKVFIGYEATSVYGTPLQYYLADDPSLKSYNPAIICFNPAIIDGFKSSMGNLPKNDSTDAFVISERLRFGRLPKSCPVDFRYLALQRLTRHRFHIVGNIVREKNYYLSNLFLKFNGLCQNNVFSNNFGAVATELFSEFLTLEDIAARPLEELIDFLMEHGKQHFDDPQATALALKDAVHKSYRINPSVDNSLNFVIKSCLENIKYLEKQKKAVEKAIQQDIEAFKNEYTCLDSVKGIGAVIAAGLISEIGGISRFDNDNALAKFSGLYWSEYQSADFVAEDTYLKRTGNEYLRYYFIQAADQLRKYLPEFSTYYARKYKESKTHKHKRALVLTARKAVRLIFALLREEKLYKHPAMKGEDINIKK